LHLLFQTFGHIGGGGGGPFHFSDFMCSQVPTAIGKFSFNIVEILFKLGSSSWGGTD
jgi:hypothetical protein